MNKTPVESKPTRKPTTLSPSAEQKAKVPISVFGTLDESFSRAKRLQLIKDFGNFSLAYSTAVQPGFSYFGNEHGYLAFMRKWGITFVLGDPVIDPKSRDELLTQFLKAYRKPSFCQISFETAKLLHDRKYWVNEMGVDTVLDLPRYDFSGKTKERFRYAANWLGKRNYSIQELTYQDVDENQVAAIVNSWRDSKSVRQESAFLNRPFTYDDEPDVRTFFLLDADDKAVAFVVFDPIYEGGRIVGYVTSFKRRAHDAPSQAEAGIAKVAIEKFKSEGIERITLGLSPLASIEDRDFRRSNPIMRFSFRRGFKSRLINRFFYNVLGHAEYKGRFCGIEEKVYYASPVFANDIRFFVMMRLCKVI